MTGVIQILADATPAAGLPARDKHTAPQSPVFERVPGARAWVRPFVEQWIERPRPRRPSSQITWKLVPIGPQRNRGFDAIRMDRSAPPSGLLIWLGDGTDENIAYDLFAACRAGWENAGISHLAICHAAAAVIGFARSISIEARFTSVRVIERAAGQRDMTLLRDELDWADAGFTAVRFDDQGRRFEPVLALHSPVIAPRARLGRRDVVLVTGGARGVGAECALRLADRTGAALLLTGRSSPQDAAVVATLRRAKVLGIHCQYLVADTTDRQQLAAAVAVAGEFGPVTALLHAAGINEPMPFQNLSENALRRAMAAKTIGLRAAIAAAGPRLRRIITFGSILGRMGLKGQAHYALANAWQTAIAEEYARAHRICDVLALEWSIWCGEGLRHRPGSLNYLARFGVDAITLDDGLAAFERLAIGGAVGTMIVTSRFGPPREVSLEPAALPIDRLFDEVLVHYPGLELVVETAILAEHSCTENQAAFPRPMGLEAMAKVASALTGRLDAPNVEAVRFKRAIVAPHIGEMRVVIAALADEDGRVAAVLRAGDDGFATDCIEAVLIYRTTS